MLQSVLEFSSMTNRSSGLFLFRLRAFLLLSTVLFGSILAFGQDDAAGRGAAKDEKRPGSNSKDATKNYTADQIAESVVVIYAFPSGREKMLQIRKTEFERGKMTTYEADGKVSNANYQRWVSRPEAGKERFRLDQEVPTATFALVQNDEKVFGIYNDSVFQPREDAIVTFQNRIAHSIESLLWYKENGAKVGLAGREKILGVDFHLIDLTDKNGRKTRYFVSAKTFRVMRLEYENAGVKYTRKFRNYKYAQGVLVPFNSELWIGEKLIEEVHLGTITFGQKLDEALFISAA